MSEIRLIELKESILEDNDRDAQALRSQLKEQKTFLLNLMSSPGSGKTSTLLALNEYFRGNIRWGVMEADIDSAVDAETMLKAGIPSIQLHTGGMCHLDADMTRQGITAFDRHDLDLIVLENIGNLVCPAEFDTGAAMNMTILSVPEGDDKPVKYPLMEKAVKKRNPDMKIFYISAKTGEGVAALAAYLIEQVKEHNQ